MIDYKLHSEYLEITREIIPRYFYIAHDTIS